MGEARYKVKALIPRMPLAESILPYLLEIDSNKWYSNFGPLNELLINRLAMYFSVEPKMICTISNATLGLQAVLCNIESDRLQTVEVPSFTFTASPAAVISSMRGLRFIDIDEELRCTPTKRAKLIMDVLPFGAPPRFPNWYRNLEFVLIDGAASFDALKSVGLNSSLNEKMAIVVSLHSTKLVGGGEGGIIISKNIDLIERIKNWQNFGIGTLNSESRESIRLGTNAKMSEYACAVALSSLDIWDETRKCYLELSGRAQEVSERYGLRTHPSMEQGFATPNWILINKDQIQTDLMRKSFREAGFETKKWWGDGCHTMSAYAGFPREDLSKTETLVKKYFGIPFHLFLPEDYWESIERILSRLLKT